MSEKHTIRLPGILLDEIQAKEDKGEYLGKRSRRSGKHPEKRVSRKEARKEERILKKQKRSSSNKEKADHINHEKSQASLDLKKQIPKIKKSALKDSGLPKVKKTASIAKKSVIIDESLNTTKRIQRSYKKLDFYDEDENEYLDSDEELSSDDLKLEVSDLYSNEQPQTAKEVFDALKNKNQRLSRTSNIKKNSINQKGKTAKEIMEALNDENETTKHKFDESEDSNFSSDEDLEDELNELYGNRNQPQTEEEVFAALKAAKLNIKKDTKINTKKKVAQAKTKTAKEIMEELNEGSKIGKESCEESENSDFSSDEDLEDELNELYGNQNQPQTEEEVFAALKKAKTNKLSALKDTNDKKSKPKTAKEIMEALDEDKKEIDVDEDESEFSSDEDLDEELEELYGNQNQPQTAEEVFAALEAAKRGKNMKEKTPEGKQFARPVFLKHDTAAKDEEDMIYYAKKLGLKDGKLSKMDDDDLVGGLLDGLDFMDSYGAQNGDNDDTENVNMMEDDFDGLAEGIEKEKIEKVRENPYVAPAEDSEDRSEAATKYIPPALRKLQLGEDDQNKLKLKRIIKGQLNKLSEVNIIVIANEINALYYDNPRNLVNETLTNTILESIYLQSKLLDSFVILYASLVAAIYRLQGVEFLVFFIQTLVEKYETFYSENVENQLKESSNLLSTLTYCYAVNVINCNLIYDIINKLIKGFSEFNSELLLRLIKNAGNQLRTDDPSALKEIVSLLHKETEGKILSPRSQFLVDSIVDLRNNKVKKHKEINENNRQLILKMKKFLGGVNNNKIHDPLTITLDDIHNIDKRGKWWLTGSAWKGKNTETEDQVTESSQNDFAGELESSAFEHLEKEAFDNDFDFDEPNWTELAKKYRINNDIRRAIFISIMSSEDYIDAFTKLDKLQLKRAQQREIPNILLHCQQLEPSFNKFYGLLAVKLCSEHMYRKTFQFCLWNFIKEINNEDEESDDEANSDVFKARITGDDGESEDVKLQKLVNSAKIYGFLIGNGALQLNLFRIVNFLTINEDSRLFLEVLFITFFEEVIKKSRAAALDSFSSKQKTGSKKVSMEFDLSILNQRLDKIEDPVLLRGIKVFLLKNVKNSSFLKNKYVKSTNWVIDLISKQ